MQLDEYKEWLKSYKKPSKYGNVRTEYNGVKYDSAKEAEYAKYLDGLLKCKGIKAWRGQVPFVLQPKFIDRNGVKHQAIKYVADFEVTHLDGTIEIQDVKGSEDFLTDMFKLKKKLLLFKYPDINFMEVYKTK